MTIERVTAYIDGFNFYYGLMAKGWGRYRWLDYHALIQRLIRAEQELTTVKYFTTRVTHEPAKQRRQDQYLRALDVQGIEIIEGQFEVREWKCPSCSKWCKRPQEKRTDVNIATHLVSDGFDGLADTMFVVSADSDLVPAVDLVQQRFGTAFVLIDPPRRHSTELAQRDGAVLTVRH